MAEEKDIYIKLMEDITGLNINPDTPILQSKAELKVATEEAKKLDAALKDSRDELCKQLGIKSNDMLVGCPPEEEDGYIEPCPIQYTGNVADGKIFHCVFLGLNPHLDKEKWRRFPAGSNFKTTTFADLANFHHPDDIRNGCNRETYSSKGTIKNNYWRVMGNMKYFEPSNIGDWSPFYKEAIRIHLALLPQKNREIYNNFKTDLQNRPNLTENLLCSLKKYPIANMELLPYKSETIDLVNFDKLLSIKGYNCYFNSIMDFLDKHTTDDAYIIATNSVSGNNGETRALDALYTGLMKYMIKSDASKVDDFYVYNRNNHQLELGKRKKAYDMAPMYLVRWNTNNKNRKVIISSPISRTNRYSWIYNDFANGWIDAIRKHFED